MSGRLCTQPGCALPHYAKGYCNAHWRRSRTETVSMDAPIRRAPAFEDCFTPGEPDRCWLWTGSIGTGGYGRLGKAYAHRTAYELAKGPIPEGLVIDHLCRTRNCVNPGHLEVVTAAENTRRGMAPNIQASRDNRCPKGHEYDADTYVRPDGYRQCRPCWRDRALAKDACADCGQVMARSSLKRHAMRMHAQEEAA